MRLTSENLLGMLAEPMELVARSLQTTLEYINWDDPYYLLSWTNQDGLDASILVFKDDTPHRVLVTGTCKPRSFAITFEALTKEFGSFGKRDTQALIKALHEAYEWADAQSDPYENIVLDTEFFIQRLKSAAPQVRGRAASSLGELGDRAAVPALLAVLSDNETDPFVAPVIEALGVIGDERAVQPLRSAREKLNDDDVVTRNVIDSALKRLNTRQRRDKT